MPDDLTGQLMGLGLDLGEEFAGDTVPEPPTNDPVSVAEGIQALGHDRGIFYYLSQSARQVFAIPAAQHSRNSLMAMASVAHYWERTAHFDQKTGVKWDQAIDALMRECRACGIYDPDRVRGRGVWMDRGRAVLHLGNALIVDGRQAPLDLPDSRHIYEAAHPLSAAVAPPLGTSGAHRLIDICTRLRWEAPVNATLFAGFMVVAPLCGGLAWRPSIWLTGGAGSGKTYISEKILCAVLGGIALQVQSKTSEAGIRQRLGSDARPLTFDEAEGEDQAAAARMQGVLDLIRQSASEGGAEIIKGGSNGAAKSYKIRICAALVSINHSVKHRADAGRITILALREPDQSPEVRESEAAAFSALNALVVDTLTPEFSAGLLARSVRLLPTIRANAETFARAVAIHTGSRRDGDQIGTLLAGAYSLHSDREISDAAALEYVQRQDWGQIGSQDTEKDESKLLTMLTQHRMRYSAGNGSSGEATVGRLIDAAFGRDPQIIAEIAAMELLQSGIRPDRDATGTAGIFVSNSHPALARILAGTPWSASWERALRRLQGAHRSESSIRFGPGHKARATWLPLSALER